MVRISQSSSLQVKELLDEYIYSESDDIFLHFFDVLAGLYRPIRKIWNDVVLEYWNKELPLNVVESLREWLYEHLYILNFEASKNYFRIENNVITIKNLCDEYNKRSIVYSKSEILEEYKNIVGDNKQEKLF